MCFTVATLTLMAIRKSETKAEQGGLEEMNKQDAIITDLETEYDVEFDINNWPDVLCDGDTCRHSECECWDDFRRASERLIKKQIADLGDAAWFQFQRDMKAKGIQPGAYTSFLAGYAIGKELHRGVKGESKVNLGIRPDPKF